MDTNIPFEALEANGTSNHNLLNTDTKTEVVTSIENNQIYKDEADLTNNKNRSLDKNLSELNNYPPPTNNFSSSANISENNTDIIKGMYQNFMYHVLLLN